MELKIEKFVDIYNKYAKLKITSYRKGYGLWYAYLNLSPTCLCVPMQIDKENTINIQLYKRVPYKVDIPQTKNKWKYVKTEKFKFTNLNHEEMVALIKKIEEVYIYERKTRNTRKIKRKS